MIVLSNIWHGSTVEAGQPAILGESGNRYEAPDNRMFHTMKHATIRRLHGLSPRIFAEQRLDDGEMTVHGPSRLYPYTGNIVCMDEKRPGLYGVGA
jgi:hypothetical protein